MLVHLKSAVPAMVVFLKGEGGDTVLATGSFMLNEEFACDWQKRWRKACKCFPPQYQQWKDSAGREKTLCR